ncbi:hypothetical protein Cni_G14986 [Canna indica]|uniref:Peptidase S59 domain-containing protein n=1 Tax=Canna indica TaxID=4628 RepID=A0AAQ3QCW0_9LILI|nr:hypothetical protein Cni_G14986 [Canna indica]
MVLAFFVPPCEVRLVAPEKTSCVAPFLNRRASVDLDPRPVRTHLPRVLASGDHHRRQAFLRGRVCHAQFRRIFSSFVKVKDQQSHRIHLLRNIMQMIMVPLPKANGIDDHKASDSYVKISGHRAGKAAIVYEHGADIEALMPKLRQDEYYTVPRIQELAAKERAEPGFCRRVKDFVIGRHGHGSIEDLNKPAEVTLLNIKYTDKRTGQQYTEGPKEMLKLKTQEQGAEFISYDPVKGEWEFKVQHFSRYELTLEITTL